ncbi:MAG: porin [Gammaproteobacteria bacterium]|nr:porin [Gammaproteobacteria bacterium]
MNKQLLAAAVASALLAPVAAVADTTVQVYGRAHLSVDWLDNGVDDGLNTSSNSSRLGFRANHDLGNGLTAFVQIEQNIRFEEGSGNFSTRDSFVGLRGDFGQFRLGQFDTPLKSVRSRTDFFGDQIGDARNLTRLRDVYGNVNDFDTRFRNGIHYRTPSFSGVVFDVHYSTNTGTGATVDNDNDALSTSITYTQGNLYLAGAYERKNETKSDAIRLGATYKIGDLDLAALAQFATLKAPAGFGGIDQDADTYGIGASYKLNGKMTIKGQYYWLSADGDEFDANMAVVGLDYRIASPFRLLFAYAHTSNDDNARYSMSRGGRDTQLATAAPGLNHSGFSVGFRYDF